MGIGPKQLIALDVVYLVVVLVASALRTWVVLKRGKGKLTASDYCLLLYALISIATTTVGIKIIWLDEKGTNAAVSPLEKLFPVFALSEDEYDLWAKLALSANPLYLIQVWLIKVSLCLTYTELSSRMSKGKLFLLRLTEFYTGISFVVAFVVYWLSCRPLSTTWTSLLDPHYCPSLNELNLSVAYVMSTTADFGLIFFAYFFIRNLRLRKGAGLALLVPVAMGVISIAASTVRFGVLLQLYVGSVSAVDKNPVTVGYTMSLWSFLESLFGFLAACLPAFRVMLRTSSQKQSYGSDSQGLPVLDYAAGSERSDGRELSDRSLDRGISFEDGK